MSFPTTNLAATVEPSREIDSLRQWAEMLPRSLRFLGVGGFGLITDLGVFTIVMGLGLHPLVARMLSLMVATLVTWRLNRALTFDRSGRHQAEESSRYALVTCIAQGTSYAIFAMLVLTVLRGFPQAAVLIGAAAAAAISYNGHRLFVFAKRRSQGCHER
jgi:putative flippase GtrA